MNMHNPIVWITIANVLYLASYSVRDILWLRVLTVVGSVLLVPYYAMQQSPLIVAIAWNGFFIAINVYWIVRLTIERRPVSFTPDESRLHLLSFPSLTPSEARDLFAMGMWEDIPTGASLVQHDKRTGRFSVILRGLADVMHHGAKIAELRQGQFVGTIDVHAEEIDMDVLVRQDTRTMCWSPVVLEGFLKNRPAVALALERSVGLEVERLLDTALQTLELSLSKTIPPTA